MSGKYRLISEIGRGGMGSVWRAEHIEWQAPVAIKVMTRDMSDHPEALARFEREVRLAAGLRSPHVVQVLDHGIDPATQTPFIAMELLEGESLAHRLRRAGRLSPAETFQIISQLVRALGRAHAAGIVHRDLKPDNVFLVRNEEETITKVLDFGVAKLTTPSVSIPKAGLTRPGSVLGTPFYMSPEQIQGSHEIDHRADLWSLAAITCECLTGRRPFEAADFAQLAVLLLTTTGRPLPSSLGPVPIGFDAWFVRATSPRISERYQSARDMAQTLAPICGIATMLAPESFPMTEEVPHSREFPSMAAVSHTAPRLFFPGLWRRPLARVALSAAVGLLLSGAGLALWYRTSSRWQPKTATLPLSPATGAPTPTVHMPPAASSPVPPVVVQPAPAIAPASPGIRVVSDPIEKPASKDLGESMAPGGDSSVVDEDSSVVVESPREGSEVDLEMKLPRGRLDKSSSSAGRGSKRTSASRAKAPKRAVPSPAPSTAKEGPDPAGVDVNGRRIRTTL